MPKKQVAVAEYGRYKCPDPEIQALIDALPKLDPERKKLWVDALLSGDYRQGQMALRGPENTFCCLGVACDISRLDSWTTTNRYLNRGGFMPSAVSRWLGDPSGSEDFCVYYGGQLRHLTSLNDDRVSFEIIAGLIINQL